MIRKFQQGGLQDAIMLFVQGLALTLQVEPDLIVLAAQQNPDALKAAVQVFQQTQNIEEAAKTFSEAMLQQVQAAKKGAKLQYLKSLKRICNDDEELVYFKKGGTVDCGCVKKQDTGGKVKETPVLKFKKTIKILPDKATQDSIEVNKYGNDDIPNKNPGDFKKNKEGKIQWTPDRTKAPYNKVKKAQKGYKSIFTKSADGRNDLEERVVGKDTMYITRNPKYGVISSSGNRFKDKLSKLEFESDRDYFNYSKLKNSKKTSKDLVKKDSKGSKMKLLERGSKCPKCGKIHSVGMGCSVAKFKKKYLWGGSLKRIPFMQNGNKFGIKLQSEIDAVNLQNRNNAKGLFEGMVSGEIVPTLPNIGRMVSSAYNGWIDPETPYLTGIAPTTGITKAKNALEALQMVKAMKAAKTATSVPKIFKPKPISNLSPLGSRVYRDLSIESSNPFRTINRMQQKDLYDLYIQEPKVFNLMKQAFKGSTLENIFDAVVTEGKLGSYNN